MHRGIVFETKQELNNGKEKEESHEKKHNT